jgi:hypothetical protein
MRANSGGSRHLSAARLDAAGLAFTLAGRFCVTRMDTKIALKPLSFRPPSYCGFDRRRSRARSDGGDHEFALAFLKGVVAMRPPPSLRDTSPASGGRIKDSALDAMRASSGGSRLLSGTSLDATGLAFTIEGRFCVTTMATKIVPKPLSFPPAASLREDVAAVRLAL